MNILNNSAYYKAADVYLRRVHAANACTRSFVKYVKARSIIIYYGHMKYVS